MIGRGRNLLTHGVTPEVVVSVVILLVRVLTSPAVDVMPEVTAEVRTPRNPGRLSGCQIRYIVVLRAGIGGRVIVTRHPRHVFKFVFVFVTLRLFVRKTQITRLNIRHINLFLFFVLLIRFGDTLVLDSD